MLVQISGTICFILGLILMKKVLFTNNKVETMLHGTKKKEWLKGIKRFAFIPLTFHWGAYFLPESSLGNIVFFNIRFTL